MPIDTITDLITDPNTCFLFGAGCSKCAGKPLMGELTDKVKEDLSASLLEVIDDLHGENERTATIEDLMNHLLQLHKVLKARRTKQKHQLNEQQIQDGLRCIQSSIAKHVGGEWEPHDIHKNFFRRITGQSGNAVRDVFSLNYDTLIEASLEDLKLPYTDGFRGAENAYFDHNSFKQPPPDEDFIRLYKLHGSVNWVRCDDGTVRRRPTTLGAEHPAVVYPAEQKYVQTQYGVYETLLSLFRERLREDRPNNKLIICGYSFSDEHINVVIEDSICSLGNNLTVFAFVGPGSDLNNQTQRLGDLSSRCDDRFNVLIGNHKCIGKGFEGEDQEAIKEQDLWRFENLVRLIVGGKL